ALEKVAADDTEGVHGYMPNTGYPHVRAAIAKTVKKELGADVTGDDIIITCGAAGGLNVIIKAIVNPGEEVLVTSPFFVEYTFYAQNHGAELKTVPAKEDFSIDLDAMEKSISEKTRIVLVNSPNNPTGKIYTRDELISLGKLLEKKSKEYGKVIYLVSDEPYRKIVFEDVEIPSMFSCYVNSIVATSHSKDLSLPGERIGYITIGPDTEYKEKLRAAMALTNRILGFVNAPGIMQRVLPYIQDASVDIDAYKRKRDLLCTGLAETDLEFTIPAGTFYLFPKSPIKDDVKFVKMLQEELILAVPGSGFGAPGYFRLSFCVAEETIKNSIPAFKRVMDKF
ncbi:MAG: pyridoxal phosphate-dependent aminotransferase, partial [Desulfobacteraceae bacterium]|nr:pyridoxal phosphate-dependent aminotransferase [Desulfobacteraceae bacterium]